MEIQVVVSLPPPLSFFFECCLIVSNKPVKANAVNRKLYPMAKKKKKKRKPHIKGGFVK